MLRWLTPLMVQTKHAVVVPEPLATHKLLTTWNDCQTWYKRRVCQQSECNTLKGGVCRVHLTAQWLSSSMLLLTQKLYAGHADAHVDQQQDGRLTKAVLQDGQHDGQRDGQRNGQTNGQPDGQTDGQHDGQPDRQLNGQLQGQLDRQLDRQHDDAAVPDRQQEDAHQDAHMDIHSKHAGLYLS